MSNFNKKRHSTQTALQWQDRFAFYGTVSVTGAAVMMIELLGTRIIGPFYGVSLIVWSSLISTALIALSVGYYVGGNLADRSKRLRLSHIVLCAAVSTSVIPLLSEPVQVMTNTLGLRAGAFTSALLLFSVPLALLGMAGPYVIKMAAKQLDYIGTTAGNVYAISTLGSVIGTLLLGFFLLPIAGTRLIILILSIVLAILSLSLSIYEYRRLPGAQNPLSWILLCLAILAAMMGAHWLRGEKQYPDYTVLSEAETYYGWVRVVDQASTGIRWLMSDSSTIGAEDLKSGLGLLGYQRVVGLLPWFNLEGKSALLIGLGSGHLINTFSNFDIKTDSIEIDPAVVEAAEKYFNFNPTGQVIVGDARYQVKKLEKKYNFIVHDCFTGGAEPIHMLSLEMIRELKANLASGGILALNFVGFTVEEDRKPVQSVARTLDQVFTNRRTFVSSPNAKFNDFIFIVSDNKLLIDDNGANQQIIAWLKQREVLIKGRNAPIITDDFNPMETLQMAKAEYYRNILIKRVGSDILFR